MSRKTFLVLLFQSVSSVLMAEKALKEKNIGYKIIPIPKHMSSECGVCIRINTEDLEHTQSVLAERVSVLSIHELIQP
jgi:Putative Se/S carrier protein-like